MITGQLDIQKSLIVPQVQIHLSPILENVDLAMLKWAHEAGIDIDVGIDLYGCDLITPVHEQPADGGRSYAFPKAAHNPACDHDISHFSRLQERSRSVYDKGDDQNR